VSTLRGTCQLRDEVEKLKKEEARYVKAYGAGIINTEQLQEVMNDLKMRRSVLEREIGHIEGEVKKTDIIVTPDENQIYKFSEAAKSRLSDLSFEAKRRIILKVVDTIIGQQRLLRVRGYLPIQEIQNVKLWSECRHKQRRKTYLQFQFRFHPPNPRKERIIVERDILGRIVHSKPPQFKFLV